MKMYCNGCRLNIKLNIYRIFNFKNSTIIVFENCQYCNNCNYLYIDKINKKINQYINDKRYGFENNNYKLVR